MSTVIRKPSSRDLNIFSLILSFGIALIFGLLMPLMSGRVFPAELPAWPWLFCVLFNLLTLIYSPAVLYIYRLWMRLGLVLGWLNTRLIMCFLYFCVFTPLGLLIRAFGGDLLSKKIDLDTRTYRSKCTSKNKNSLEKPY